MSSDLHGRVAVVFGVANKRSIAWSIAQGLHNAGAKLAVTYQNERLEEEARDLILSLPGAEAFMCDVSNDIEIEALFGKLKERYDKLHVLVHSVAFAPADELKGEFLDTTRERSEEHTSELQSRGHPVCRLLLEKKKTVNTAKRLGVK